MQNLLLGIDIGGTMAKAALFAPDGRELAVASSKTAALTPHPGWIEWDMETLWQAAAGAIRQVLTQAGVNPKHIAAIACTGHGNGLYLVDEHARPTRPAIGSADGRARSYIEAWSASGLDQTLRPKTMQAIWPAQPNALLRWLKDHEPDTLKKSRWVLMAKDYIRARLTGRIFMELSDMSATSLMNVGTERYEDDILAAWGLLDLKPMLPPLKRSSDLCGAITAEAAALTGLSEGTPVAGGMFDIDACGLASGMIDESQLCMVGGTWGNNQYISKTPIASGDVFMTSCYAIPGYYLMLEGSATSASNLEWWVTEFFAAEREAARRQGQSVYDLVNSLVAETKPDANGPVFLPFLYGSNVGLDAKACLFGLDGWQSRGQVLRAVYEGVIFAHRQHFEKLLRFRPRPASIRLTGGASRSAIWTQMFADVFQIPVEVPAGTELGALGAAICAAVASGVHPSYPAACSAMVNIARTHQPQPDLAPLYQRKYDRYSRLLKTLQPAWQDLAWRP